MPKADLLQKKLIIADWPKYLRNSFTHRGGSPNGRALALHARGTEINAPHLHNLRTFVIFIRFLKKNYCVLKLPSKLRLSEKKPHSCRLS